LKEELGEPELRNLLEELGNSDQSGSGVNVQEVMDLANKKLESN